MKITIDESTFNKALSLGKLELADWLIDQGCPSDNLCYIQNFDIKVLEWLNIKNIIVPKSCLSDVIDKTGDMKVVTWFLEKGVLVDMGSLLACIRNERNDLFMILVKKTNLTLGVDAFKTAIMAENLVMLDYLKSINCKSDETLIEISMKYKKKNSLKWLVTNGFFD
jgi:hypothetical protein